MSKYVKDIIEAVKISNPESAKMNVSAETRFQDIPGMDSMTIVNFQMDLSSIIGEKAQEVLPMPEMSVAELSEILESLD